jgi:hypothetical protein
MWVNSNRRANNFSIRSQQFGDAFSLYSTHTNAPIYAFTSCFLAPFYGIVYVQGDKMAVGQSRTQQNSSSPIMTSTSFAVLRCVGTLQLEYWTRTIQQFRLYYLLFE